MKTPLQLQITESNISGQRESCCNHEGILTATDGKLKENTKPGKNSKLAAYEVWLFFFFLHHAPSNDFNFLCNLSKVCFFKKKSVLNFTAMIAPGL